MSHHRSNRFKEPLTLTLRETIEDPKMANVHQQINSTIAKLLVGGPNKQWKLITFDVPNRDCTVSDLLKEACITFMRWNDKLQLVSDSSNVGVNYILYMKGLADVEDYLQSSDEDEEAER